MPKFYKTKGIILKRQDFGEADKILTIYTASQGKIKAKALGIRKVLSKLGGHLELFNLVDLSLVTGKSLDTITACQTIETFPNLKGNLRKTSLAYYAAELLDKLTLEKQKDYRIFRLIEEIFTALNNKAPVEKKNFYLLIRSFELKLLSFLGYTPELKKCVACGKLIKPELCYFSVVLGGLLCSADKKQDIKSIKITPNAIKTIRYLLEKDFSLVNKLKLPDIVFKEIRNIIISFVRYILQGELKTRAFVKKIERLG